MKPSEVLRRAKQIVLARQATTIPEAIYEVIREITNRAESLFVEANEVKNIYKWRVGPKGVSELAIAFDRAIELAEAEEAAE